MHATLASPRPLLFGWVADVVDQRNFMAQFDKAREELAKLRQVFPSLFDKDGRPLVATLTFPRSAAEATAPEQQGGGK